MVLDGTAFFDIFSCKEIEAETAKKIVEEYFHPQKMRVNFITRHAD
jgi:S-adenosylmethionine/arginine decarboxylase-like enzyme